MLNLLTQVRRFLSATSQGPAKRRPRNASPFRPRLEGLEDRWAPSTFSITAPIVPSHAAAVTSSSITNTAAPATGPTLQNTGDINAGQSWTPVVTMSLPKGGHPRAGFQLPGSSDEKSTRAEIKLTHEKCGESYTITGKPVTYDKPGDYTVYLTVQDDGSIHTYSFQITVH